MRSGEGVRVQLVATETGVLASENMAVLVC